MDVVYICITSCGVIDHHCLVILLVSILSLSTVSTLPHQPTNTLPYLMWQPLCTHILLNKSWQFDFNKNIVFFFLHPELVQVGLYLVRLTSA